MIVAEENKKGNCKGKRKHRFKKPAPDAMVPALPKNPGSQHEGVN
jgi:hypothetical protein